MSKGYFTIAQGESYQRLAYALALSLKISQPKEYSKLSIGVTTEELNKVNPKFKEVFDEIIEIPWGDAAFDQEWVFENEWKAIHMSPYDETIKLDADMLFLSDISKWWNTLSLSEGVFVTKPQTYRGEVITSDICRKVFTVNDLPNIYTAFFYFKKTEANFELFKLAELIFQNWERFFYEFFAFEHRPKFASTDVVFSLAAKILDYDKLNQVPNSSYPTFTHMKAELQNIGNPILEDNDWTKAIRHYFNNDCQLTIENFRQQLPFHYQEKKFMTDEIIVKMEKKLGI